MKRITKVQFWRWSTPISRLSSILARLGLLWLLAAGLFTFLTLPIILAAGPSDLDLGFGNSGIVTTTISSYAYGQAIGLQPDGKIVVVGRSSITSNINSNQNFTLARYDNTGSLDSNFGNNGIVTTSIGNNAIANDVALQPDGKILVVGQSDNGSLPTFALARYTITGSLDTDFGSGGIVTTSIDKIASGYAVAVQPDGKILVAGQSSGGSIYTFALARYTITGTLDSNFGNGGVVTTSIGERDALGRAVVLQPNKAKIVVGGTSANIPPGTPNPISTFAMARYHSNGSLDGSFGNNGVVTTPIGLASTGTPIAGSNDMVIQPDGKIIAAGYAAIGYDLFFALARYHSGGSLDSSFGSDGAITTSISHFSDSISDISLQPDGKIVATGSSLGLGACHYLALARYHSNGSLDQGFDGDGILQTHFGQMFCRGVANAVAIQADNKIIAAGYSMVDVPYTAFALARFTGGDLPPVAYLPLILKN